jgi:hypothetical protein
MWVTDGTPSKIVLESLHLPNVLVLDTQEVTVKQGEFVVNRGSNHAWSNRSGKPAVVAIASHDGK